MDKKHSDQMYEQYFDSIFAGSNIYSKEEYDRNATAFDRLYGRFMPASRDARILDIGCGAGQFLYYLTTKGYVNFEGIDISSSQLEFCRKNFTEKVRQADALDFLASTIDTYDLITANDVIEHIPKDKVVDFVRLVAGALRPGGMLLLKCPNMGNPFSLYARYRDFTHESGFTDTSLRQVLYLGGFKDIEILPSSIPFTLIESLTLRPLLSFFRFMLMKLFWWQGYVAPRIVSPLLIGRAVKQR